VAKDHFISQVYLRNFCSDSSDKKTLHCYRKSDLKYFEPRPKDVCWISDGSTNPYFENERQIEEFLKLIEGKLNPAIDSFSKECPGLYDVFVISAFLSYFFTCSPSGGRILSSPIRETYLNAIDVLDRDNSIPMLNGGRKLSTALNCGEIDLKVNPKFAQSFGIGNLQRLINNFGNQRWDIIFNKNTDTPFLTSDFPIVIEDMVGTQFASKMLPLTPNIAIKIYPTKKYETDSTSFYTFTEFRPSYLQISRSQAIDANRKIIRAADDMVFSNHNEHWLEKFISKNRNFRTDVETTNLRGVNSGMIISRPCILPYNWKP
jgi:Protein of unknown function (DUF4238)